jgi:hypothetical protein
LPIPVAGRPKHVGLRSLACWGYGFESHRGHGILSVVSVVCCQVRVVASSSSLVQGIPTEFGVSECDPEASITRKTRHGRGCYAFCGGGGIISRTQLKSRAGET